MQNWKNKSFTMSACKPNNKNSNSLDFDQDLTHCTHTDTFRYSEFELGDVVKTLQRQAADDEKFTCHISNFNRSQSLMRCFVVRVALLSDITVTVPRGGTCPAFADATTALIKART